jgi:autotransporter-associated beta strand protein
LTAAGNLTLQDNAVINLAYGTVTANPSAAAISVAGGISAPGSNIVVNITATGLSAGTFTLVTYTGATLANLSNFQLSPPPGVGATLVNNTANHSIDVQVTSTPNQLAWNGVNGTNWDLATANWTNLIAGGITVFRQYTNGSVVAGDSVVFDDTLTNDFINPQPTNINLTARYYAFPWVVNSTLPYTIAGAGGLQGVTSLVISNTGSLTLLTSNSFTGGVFLNDTSSLIITNESALGASSGAVTLNGGSLQINGSLTNSRAFALPTASTIGVSTNNTVRLGGVISGAGASLSKSGNGTLILAANEKISGSVFLHGGFTIIDSGGSITNVNYNDVGQNTTDAATLTLRGTSALATTSDFNVGDLDSSVGILNVTNSAVLTVNAFFIGSANASGSTAVGTVNQSGGTIAQTSTTVGTFAIGGRSSTAGVGTYNLSGGTLTATAGIRVGGTGVGTLNQSGGTINALAGINIARIVGSVGTNNLNGGTLATYNVASSTGTNAVFNFNGGTLQAAFNPGTPWVSGLSQANLLAGGAVIDSSNYSVTISQPLLAGSAAGGLTKKGAGTLTLTGVNTFTGPLTNNAGTLFLNSASTYAGAAAANAGILQMTTASVIQGGVMVSNNATFSINQVGSATATIGNLTFNGGTTFPGGTLVLVPTMSNNPAVPLLDCGTLTVSGTNTISLPIQTVGTVALVKYSGSIAGSGNCTNLALPQGANGYISNNAASSTLYAVITSTGPGIVWTGTNSAAGRVNLWDISSTTNWALGSVPTSYHQVVVPGDLVTFNDLGSGTVLVSNSLAPTSLIISNNSKTYTFSGPGGITGPTGLELLGSGTATLNLTNDSYTGSTVISNGVLAVGNNGVGASLSPSANLVIGSAGTLQLSAQLANVTSTVGEWSGAGVLNYSGGINSILAFGGSAGGTWNGTLQNSGGGGLSLTKNGTGTWVVGGTNRLINGDYFNAVSQAQFNGGTTILTNGSLLTVSFTEFWIAANAGSTSTVVVAGGTLAVSNNWLRVGDGPTASGTLIVNRGTVVKAGLNNIDVGANGSVGTLIVNGGQVLNQGPLWLADSNGATGILYLNGGLLQASQVLPNASPASSTAYFNGGTLKAATNNADFINSGTTPLIQSGGLILDDGGFAISMTSQAFQEDPASTGGGLIKQGAGQLYLDSANSYTGSTVVSNGLLAGTGSLTGPVVVAPGGALGAGDAGSVGTLTINNTLTLQGQVNMRVAKNGGTVTSDLISGVTSVSYAGTLVVSNATSDATALALGDSFTLFSASGPSGNFARILGSPGTGLGYSFNPAAGTLTVVTGLANYPTNITATVSSGALSLTWPKTHLGWVLQAQTNTLSAGLNGSWVDVANSSTTNAMTFPLNPLNPAVFYRLSEAP